MSARTSPPPSREPRSVAADDPLFEPAPMAAASPFLTAYTLRLREVRFSAHIGVSLEERAVLQELLVDADLTLSVEGLPRLDALDEVVDYDGVVRRIVEEGTASSHRLLESYAMRVISRLLADFPVSRLRVAVTKKQVPTHYPVAAAVVELVATRPSTALTTAVRKGARAESHAPLGVFTMMQSTPRPRAVRLVRRAHQADRGHR